MDSFPREMTRVVLKPVANSKRGSKNKTLSDSLTWNGASSNDVADKEGQTRKPVLWEGRIGYE